MYVHILYFVLFCMFLISAIKKKKKDYLPKLTVVYFLRVRRGTSPHQTRETNAGGGGVRRNTRRVKPTPEEEEYVATQDA